jgi:hypothetical protein
MTPLLVPETLKEDPDEPDIEDKALPKLALLVEFITIGKTLMFLLLEPEGLLFVVIVTSPPA